MTLENKGVLLGLGERTPSFMRNLYLRHFPASFCKHPCACRCCCAHTQHTQHTQHAAMVHLQEHTASYLWPELYEKPGVNGCDMAQIGLQGPRLMPHVTGDSLPPEMNFCSGSCTMVHPGREKGRQAFSQRLAQTSPPTLISTWLAGIS